MLQVDIKINNHQQIFTVGERVSGTVELEMPEEVSKVENLSISFGCMAEVKWTDYVSSPYYVDATVSHDRHYFHRENLVLEQPVISKESADNFKNVSIPFEFWIPDDKNLPSSMYSQQGFIKYFILFSYNDNGQQEECMREIFVQAQLKENLMVSVGASAEKTVLLHHGKVSMHASIDRKGYARGESIQVHIAIQNSTGTTVTPRLTFHQVQLFNSGTRHRLIDQSVFEDEQPIRGKEIKAHSNDEQIIKVTIPFGDALSLKCSMISVKYFLRIVLDIPHSFDLRLDLPVVLTTQNVIGL